MTQRAYSGVVVPMVTPVKNGSVDLEAVATIIRSFAEAGVDTLIMGTTGEGNSVPMGEGIDMIHTAVEAAEGKVRIYAGVTGLCLKEQLSQIEGFARAGADVAVAVLPSYYALTEEQMVGYYTALADASPLPVMLYNILATTHLSIPVEAVRKLAEHPNIVGLKDSERDLERMAACIEIARSREDFTYFCGWAAQSAHSLELGADGIVPSTGNFVPKHFQALYEAAVSGDMEEANRLQAVTDEMAKIYQQGRPLGQQLAALKCIMEQCELCGREMLPPLTMLPEAEYTKIIEQITEFELE
ncbi:MAG: dihydrodipicolinate synthase family protein [Alistipes sp.]|nr:dihydrodipicolinate synthase family protein [Alistipes sp.]MBQ3082809.1 dihydrodipicolinate synthase family protein [Alistipes sp.]MBQ8471425.1 dihydrodipicolinate synthase family protein [Alistipes sp.]